MSTTISSSDLFREESVSIWSALHHHPFITELSEGTLPLDKFRFFLEQDIFYLEEYARCLAMGIAKSRSERELRYFTCGVNKSDRAVDMRLCRNPGDPVRLRPCSRCSCIGSCARCSPCSSARVSRTGSWRSPCSATS